MVQARIIKVEKVVSTFIRRIGRFLFWFAKCNFCPSRKTDRVNYSLSQSNELNNMHPYISGHIYIFTYIYIYIYMEDLWSIWIWLENWQIYEKHGLYTGAVSWVGKKESTCTPAFLFWHGVRTQPRQELIRFSHRNAVGYIHTSWIRYLDKCKSTLLNLFWGHTKNF